MTERPGAVALGRARGEVELRGVAFRYPGAARDALRGLDLTIEPGRTVALTGPERRREVDRRTAAAALRRPVRGRRPPRRARPARPDARERARERRRCWPRRRCCRTSPCARRSRTGRAGATGAEVEAAARAAGADGVHPRAAGRLRDAARPARPAALGRPAPAARHRPRARPRRAGARARRADHGPRRRGEGRAARPAAHARRRPHDARHHARPRGARVGRPGRRARAGRGWLEIAVAMRPLGPGARVGAAREVIAHLARSNVLDVYDAWDASADAASRSRRCDPTVGATRGRGRRCCARDGCSRGSTTRIWCGPTQSATGSGRRSCSRRCAARRSARCSSAAALGVAESCHLGAAAGQRARLPPRRGLVHLDVKPSNVIADAGTATLIDLSIARRPGRVRAGTGTWCYARAGAGPRRRTPARPPTSGASPRSCTRR